MPRNLPYGDSADEFVPRELSPDIDPWEQQPGESDLWYSRFLLFLDIPPHGRSNLRAYANWSNLDNIQRENEGKCKVERKLNTVPESWSKYSRYWRWAERAKAKDTQDRIKARARKMERLQQLEEDEWETALKLLEKAKEMASYPLVTQTTSDEGRTIIINPQKWAASDAARYLAIGSEIARRSVGAVEAIEPMAALQVLVNEGWIPESVLDVAAEELHSLPEKIKAAFASLDLSPSAAPAETDDLEDEDPNDEPA